MSTHWIYLRNMVLVLGLSTGFSGLFAQQMANRPAFNEMAYLWNPAMTAMNQALEVSLAYRRQWAGFDGSPRTAAIGFQVPLTEHGMSIGGFFNHDEVQPMIFNQIGMTYAYGFRPGLGSNDRLTVGLAGLADQQLFDGLDLVVNDPDDERIPVGEGNQFMLNAAAGFLYQSNVSDRVGKASFYFGAAATRLIPGSFDYSVMGSTAKYRNRMHANAVVGLRMVRDVFVVEPSVWMDYVQDHLFQTNLSVRFEMIDTFWAGINYSSASLMNFQVGAFFKNVLAKEGYIKVGTQGSFNMGDIAAARGGSYDFYLGYQYMF